MPKMTVAIPTTGSIENLSRVLSSVAKQDGLEDAYVVVVINGVNQQAYSFICDALRRFNFVHFSHLSQANVNMARNKAFELATAEYILFLDDDCELRSTKTLQKYLQLHLNNKNVFAFGGGYELAGRSGLFDRIYNEIQMRWLLSQRGHVLSPTVSVNYLLGGNFCVNREMMQADQLKFNENFPYGGTETELFEQARQKKLIVKLCEIDVNHYTQENLLSVIRKVYKQGQGRSKINQLHPLAAENQRAAISEAQNAEVLHVYWHLFFNYIFWLGFYSRSGRSFKIITHIIYDLCGYLNKKRHQFLRFLRSR